ncbi:type II toxin-antitoxin system RelE/ParE family toxin [uncultured Anaerovibrio sp.]|uniref:type II toxin-antitoxin system RelE/ParE family toxin n=1 Tax=uncultured Anaerovibrio sp. TaxID=361586 RepID=UPI0025DEC843|nr:type II toxin-antitoxin system RelE/ParE family toxin [uncultured Anaerovibrio sp.]
MSYTVEYTIEAKQDLHDIYKYISNGLLSPETAVNQTKRIMDAIDKLDEMPLRNPVWKDEPWKSQGIRYFPVGNFVVFYLPKENAGKVYVARIMYGGRDISNLSKDSLMI